MSTDDLTRLYDLLGELRDELHDEAKVPDHCKTTRAGLLAEADADAFVRARQVAHRLLLWNLYPTASPESYFALDPAAELHSVRADFEASL